MLPLRWYVRPVLGVIGAATGALALSAGAGSPARPALPTLLVVQAGGAGPDAREQAAAAALTLLDHRGDVTRARRLSAEEVAARLAHVGVTLPPGALPLPPMIEARVAPEDDPATLEATLARIPGIAVDRSPWRPTPTRRGPHLLTALAIGALLVVASAQEARARSAAVRVLRQLGAFPLSALLHPLAAAGVSLAVGIAVGDAVAAMIGFAPLDEAQVIAIGASEVALVTSVLAMLLARRT